MIIVQLKGGLGNQLFQYAAGLCLGKYHNVPVKVDLTELKVPDKQIGTLRNYELQHLLNPPKIANQNEIDLLIKQNVFTKYFQKTLPSYQRTIYNEKQFRFDKNFFKAGKNLYLKGYRQSEKYFLSISGFIRTAFQFKPALIASVAEISNKLENNETVAIHIRRGDYANPAVNSYHGIASAEYYQDAINKIASSINNPFFYVFSDNIAWIKKTLQFDHPVEFLSGEISRNHYEDFYLMSRCKHQIIANSSFGWWAGWLNPNPAKIVIAPEKWFNNAPLDTSDLIPQGWLKL